MKETQEAKDLKRYIKKLNSKIRYLEKVVEYKNQYIDELENIEENRLILFLRHIKEDEILDFHYSCGLTENEDSLTYNIYVKRKYTSGDE